MKTLEMRKQCVENCGYDHKAIWVLKEKKSVMTEEQLKEFIENQKRTFTKHEHTCKYNWRVTE